MPDEIVDDEPVVDPPAPPAKPKPAVKPDPIDPEDMSPEELAAENRRIKKALKEANASDQKGREARKRLQELEEERERLEAEKLSENEKRERRIAAAEARLKEAEEKAAKLERENVQMRIDNEVRNELKRQGIGSVELCVKALRGDQSIEIDQDSGKILGVKDAIKKLISENEDLVVGIPRGNGTPTRDNNPYRVPPRSGGKPVEPVANQAEVDQHTLATRLNYGF